MAENLYFMGAGYLSTTALTGSTSGPTAVSTGTAGKTSVLVQVATPSTRQIAIVEYGVSLSGSPASAQLSLLVSSAAATTTNAVAGIILPYTNPNAPTALCVSSTSLCAYFTASTAPAPGNCTALFDTQLLTTNTYVKQFPLAREPVVPVSSFLQVCINVPTTAVTAYAYVVWRE
jgi:hypothetical protein